MYRTIIPAVAIAVLMGLAAGSGALAKTPDGKTPAEETVCDTLPKRLFGICNAYCEATDCDGENPRASARACDRLRTRYEEQAGEAPPCDPLSCNEACDSVRIECLNDGGECEECAFVFAACLVDQGCQPPPSDTCDDDTAGHTPGGDVDDTPSDGGPTGGGPVVAGSDDDGLLGVPEFP